MRKVLITGIAGFAGSHLAGHLKKKAEVWGTCLDNNLSNLAGIEGLRLIGCDLADPKKVLDVIEEVRPDAVFHLAAQSNPSASFADPAHTLRINIFSTLNLFEAVLKASPDTVILNVGSGDEYGEVDSTELPIKESAELRPVNPYAVSKVAADLLGFQYWNSRRLKVVRCRPFNHFGPRQADNFVASSFARQIAEIESDKKGDKVIKVGNLDAAKDFLHVRDIVSAYELLIDKGVYGEVYNICSGEPVRIRKILEILLCFSDEKIEIVQDSVRLRSKEAGSIYGDAARLKSLGWSRRVSLEDGLKELLDFWRGKVKVAPV